MGVTRLGPDAIAGPRLEPLDLGKMIDTAFKLYTQNATALWTIVATIVLPLQVIWVIASRIILGSAYEVNGILGHGLYTTSGRATAINLLLELMVVLGSLLSTGAVFKYQLDSYLGRPRTVSSSFEFAFANHRVFSLLWVSILAIVLTIAGLILLIVGAVWVWVSVAFAVPVLMLEGKTGFSAISRSFDLVKNLWWATFGRLLVTAIMLGVVYGITEAIGNAIANSLTSPLVWLIVRAIFFSIGAVLLAPFFAAVTNVIYIDLRVRKEGMDHDTLATQLDAPGTVTASPTTGAAQATAPPPAESPGTEPPPPSDTPPAG